MTTTRVVPQVVSDLQAARDLLARSRWLQESLYEPPDGYCVVGAVYSAFGAGGYGGCGSGIYVRRTNALALLDQATGNPNLNNGMATVDFNNHPGRTKEEILGLFDKAIALGMHAPQIAG